MEFNERWHPVLRDYCPLKAGSIDGTDTRPHDRAVERALKAIYKPNKAVQGDPECTLFVGRLDPATSENTLNKIFSQYGDILHLRLVRDIVTGMSKQYAFVEFTKQRYATRAMRDANHLAVDGLEILVEWECERTLPKWIPRRLGGGFGGKKESGQLRFGSTDRPFRKPIIIAKHGTQDRYRERRGGNHYDGEGDKDSRERDGGRNREDDRRYDRRRDRERDGDRHTDRHADRHREGDTGRYRDRDRDMYSDRRGDRERPRHRDGDSHRYTHKEDGTHGQETVIKTEQGTRLDTPSIASPSSNSKLVIMNIKQEKL